MGQEILKPNGVGSQTDIENQYPNSGYHWDKVDEDTTEHDDFTTTVYNNSADGVWKRDLFTIESSEIGFGVITKIRVYIYAAVNVADVKPSIRTYSTTYDLAPNGYNGDFPGLWHYAEWTTNPYTGEPWRWGEIDALEIGVALQDSGVANPDNCHCSALILWIDYTDAPAISFKPRVIIM